MATTLNVKLRVDPLPVLSTLRRETPGCVRVECVLPESVEGDVLYRLVCIDVARDQADEAALYLRGRADVESVEYAPVRRAL